MSKFKGNQAFKQKLAKRIMAIVLSGAMVMSNMSAYAAELTTEAETEVVSEVEVVEESDNDVADNADGTDGGDTGNTDSGSGTTDPDTTPGESTETTATLPKPTGLAVTKETKDETTTLTLVWTKVEKPEGYEAATYKVEVTEKNGSAVEVSDNDNLSEAKFETNALTAGKTYTFTVTATSAKTGESGTTIKSSATVDYEYEDDTPAQVTVPKPGNLSVSHTITDGKVTADFSWDAVTVTDYTVKYDVTVTEKGNSSAAKIEKSDLTAVTVKIGDASGETLEAGKTYVFSVTAKAEKDGKTTESAAATEEYAIPNSSTENPSETTKYVVEVNDLEKAATAGDLVKEDEDGKTRNGEKAGTDDYFKMWYSAKAKIDGNGKNWADYNNIPGDDGKFPDINRINYGAKMAVGTTIENAIEFTTKNPAKVTVWWAANYDGKGTADDREMAIQKKDNNGSGTIVAQTKLGKAVKKNSPYKSTLRLSEAGTYYLGSLAGGNYLFKVEVEESETASTRKAWGEVGSPTVTAALKTTTTTDAEGNETTKTDETTIVVTVAGVALEDNGGDVLTVTMSKDGSEDVSQVDAASKAEYTYEFKPTESGTYKFKAVLSRLNEDGQEESGKKESNEASFDFTMPFLAPAKVTAADKSEGDKAAVELKWDAVVGADCYVVTAKEAGAAADAAPVFSKNDVEGSPFIIDTGLVREKTYIFSVQGKINAAEGSAEQLTEATTAEFTIPKAPSGEAVEKTYVLDVGELYPTYTSSTPQTDRTMAIGAVKRTEDNFFTIYYRNEGTGQSRIDVDSAKTFPDGTTATHCINTGAAVNSSTPSAAIKFETPSANAKVKVYWRGGSDGARKIGIKDKDNNEVEDCSATSASTAKAGDPQYNEFTIPTAGTYYLGSLDGANRFYRVEVTVSVESQATTETYLFNAEDIPDPETDGTSVIADGTTYADGYFRTAGTVKSRTANATAGTAKRVELAKNSGGKIIFTVVGTADVEIEVSSTGGSNHSMAGIVKKDAPDTIITNTEGKRFVYALDKTKLTYKELPAGEYWIVSPAPTADDITNASVGLESQDKMGRSAFLYTIKVTETRTGEEEEKQRTEWSTIAAPVIKEVALDAENKGKINVTVTALVDYYEGGDMVTVYMDKKDAAEGEEGVKGTSVAEKSEHIITFEPESSGTYVFRAELSRNDNGEEMKKPAAETKELPFTLPLAKPYIKSTTSKGKVADKDSGSVEVAWDEVKEATGYTIKYRKQDAADDTAVTVDVGSDKFEYLVTEGLEIGATYVFTMTAKRAGTGADGADEISAVSDPSSVEITQDSKTTWAFSAYADSTSTNTNGYTDKEKVGKNDGKEMPLVELTQITDSDPKVDESDKDFVRVWSMGGAGKIVPNSVDGLAFYYTKINPDTTNFKLTATAHVNDWTLSNAQDGFGIMAADRVGKHGDSGKWWNNSYQALASKVEYRWNPDKAIPDYSGNEEYPRYSMRLGVGSTEKLGVTKENLPEFNDTDTVVAATTKYFKTDTKTLDASTKDLPAGTYNIVGNYTGGTPAGTQADLLVTDLKFTIELNATGYFLSYTPIYAGGKEGTTMTNKYYDRKALSHIEEDAVYVGFFAARNADVTFKDVTLETRDFDPTEEPEKRPVDKILPAYSVSSGTTANNSKYDLLFSANWPGRLTIKDGKGDTVIAPAKDANGKELNNITADEYGRTETFKSPQPVELGIGVNTFQWTFTPDENYIYDPNPNYKDDGSTPSEPRSFTELSDFAAQTGTFTVTYKTYGSEGEALYVSPKGTAAGTGTKANPLDIYTAVKYVQSGQTIYLMEGTYNLSRTVTVGRGISGTVDVEYETDENGNILYDGYDFKKVKSYEVKEYIYMLPAPGAKTRPVLDFGRVCEGFVVAGDAWYIKGIDVTKSQLSKDGMRVCGSYNVIEDVHTYNNGNTGLQISRFGSDSKNFWPSYNLILNCTSYLNADQGFEDADGFAAKLTIGQGNVFDGCIAAYNADDGWDLFAKVESGNIGKVVIKNSIAYRNGYVLVKDPNGDGKITNNEARDANRILALDGTEYPAGNGNGFKMGGSNLPGGHTLYNSAAFYNAAKGIDSNSCVDIKAYNSISFNNEKYNVAFYGTASNTDFASAGLISYRTDEQYAKWEKQGDGTMVKTGEMISYIGGKDHRDQLEPKGAQLKDESAYKNETSYFYGMDESKEGLATSTNSKGVAVSADWFVKADNAAFAEFDEAMKADMDYARVDGKINLHGFLELTDKAGTATGGSTGLGGAASEEKDKLPQIPENVPTTSGDVSSGDAGEETTSGVRPEDMDQYTENLKNDKNNDGVLDLWFNIVDSGDIYYTGKAVKPEIHVYDDTTLLSKKDYTITYKNNVNAYVGAGTCGGENDAQLKAAYKGVEKKPTIIVKGKGNYINAAAEQYFDIHPVDFANSPADASKPYIVARDVAFESGKAGKPAPVVTYNGKKLSMGKDYEAAGPTANKITITAVKGGNYTGSTTVAYKEVAKEKLAKNFKISKIPDQQRRGYNNYDVKDPIPVTLDSILDKDVTVTADKKLTFGTDYTVVYENNIEVGSATAVFVGLGDYAGTKEVKFKIVAQDINRLVKENSLKIKEGTKDITTEKKLADEDYKGAAIRKKNISVTDGSTILELDKDYTLTYKGNNKAGNATIVIKGIGNYSGSITKSFKINPLDLNALPSNIEIGGTFAKDYKLVANYEKGGSKPNVELVIREKDSTGKVIKSNRMIQGKDFSVAYKKNTLAGTNGTITLTGKGGLKGKLPEKEFTIVKKNLSDPDILITAEDVTVSAAEKPSPLSPKITILDANGKKLSAGADYDKDIVYEKISGEGTLTKEGNKTTVSIKNEKDILTIKATIKAATVDKCGYAGEISTTFRVGYAKQSIKSARVTVNYKNTKDGKEYKYFDYTGQPIKLNQNGVTDNLEVYLGKDKLTYGKDYEIMTAPDYVETYTKNIEKGAASVTIIGIGDYTGTKIVKYNIGAKLFSWDDVAAKLNSILQ